VAHCSMLVNQCFPPGMIFAGTCVSTSDRDRCPRQKFDMVEDILWEIFYMGDVRWELVSICFFHFFVKFKECSFSGQLFNPGFD